MTESIIFWSDRLRLEQIKPLQFGAAEPRNILALVDSIEL